MTEKDFVDRFRYLIGEIWPDRFACTAMDAETARRV